MKGKKKTQVKQQENKKWGIQIHDSKNLDDNSRIDGIRSGSGNSNGNTNANSSGVSKLKNVSSIHLRIKVNEEMVTSGLDDEVAHDV